ncbi:hypothetical protein PHMEG_00034892 [Phytophthora megakarya]|uniref:CCHC-type domain-containing protein n=1 Tax=Phytophthora megakarya TaxID=4795 RepID=A0A225UQE1_9STRA|nr:hypothetical protein PHMEG_00034892 [Phytophthora megakarya]
MDVMVKSVHAQPGHAVNPWSQRLFTTSSPADDDVDMSEGPNPKFRFLRSLYSPQQIGDDFAHQERAEISATKLGSFEKHVKLDMDFQVILGDRTIQRKKYFKASSKERSCAISSRTFLNGLQKIQNTIKAQVEGDLFLQLYPDFHVYLQFQSRKRLTNEFLLGIENGGNDPAKVIAMLREAKQICYDQVQYATHIIFWTREMASKWSREFSTLLFRNRRFPLRNIHEQESSAAIETTQRSSVVWARQVGADGIRNELPRERYHVRLLNLSRYLDEAAIDAYIQANFTGTYYTSQEPTTANQMLQTDTWDPFFKSNHCPQFLEGVRFIDWDGTKILVHHVSRSPAPPCFACGAVGHMRTMCNVEDDFWRTHYSLQVTASEIDDLPHNP